MEFKLQVQKREHHGKKAQQLVQGGQVLGNISGKGLESVSVQGDYTSVNKMIQAAGKNNPIELEVDGSENQLVLVNDVERDAITQRLHHVSFQVIIRGQKVTAEVPIHLVGESPAEKLGMIVVTLMDAVEVDAIPSKLPQSIEIDMTPLAEENDNITIADIPAMEGVEIKADPSLLIAKVDVPRAQVEEEPEDEEEVDAADVPSDHGSESADGGNSEDGSEKS